MSSRLPTRSHRIASALPVRRSVAVLTRIKGGRVVRSLPTAEMASPTSGIRDGRSSRRPATPAPMRRMTLPASSSWRAPSTSILTSPGTNVNTARLLLPELHHGAGARHAQTPTVETPTGAPSRPAGLYAAMGFTTVVEPAVAPTDALHAHLELADIPIIDKATLSGVLGNTMTICWGLLRADASASHVRDYVAWTLATSRGAQESRSSMPAAPPRSNATCVSSPSMT